MRIPFTHLRDHVFLGATTYRRGTGSYLCAVALAALLLALLCTSAACDSLTVALGPAEGILVPAKGVSTASKHTRQRLERITIPGFSTCSADCNPALPFRVIHVALPPDADELSVRLQEEKPSATVLSGTYELAPSPAIAPLDAKGETQLSSANASIYSTNAFYPREQVRVVSVGRMRACKIATIEYWPYSYNPTSGKLRKLGSAAVKLSFDRMAEQDAARTPSMTVVPGFVANRDEAQVWYDIGPMAEPAPVSMPGYAIVTTRAIAEASAKLRAFADILEMRGFSVTIATEGEWGGGTGDAAAENIRRWLAARYVDLGLTYVLLIGNPDPGSGDVPMKMLWPRARYSSYRDAPSDYYYADLTGNWDLDSDGNYGEEPDDFGPGGIDRLPEVCVGRLPCRGSVNEIDRILQRTIDYESAAPGDWTRRVVLPLKPLDMYTPSYELGEQMAADIAAPAGLSTCRIYESDYDLVPPPERFPCTYDTVAEEWGKGAGLVCWMAHGGAGVASDVLSVSGCADLDGSKPSFVFQASCSNGYPEDPGNLAGAVLRSAALNTIASSRACWYYIGETDYTNSDSAGGLAYQYARFLVQNRESCGHALMDARLTAPMCIWPNQLVFNLYGDPSAALGEVAPGALVGSVLTVGGDPIPGALVKSVHGDASTLSRGDGSYLLRGLAEGAHDIVVSAPGFHTQRFYAVPVQVGTAMRLDARLAVASSGSILGRVSDAYDTPLPDALVTVGGSSYETYTLWDGTFCIEGVPSGSYVVTASKPPYADETIAGCTVGDGASVEIGIVLRSRTGNAIANGGFEDGFVDGVGLPWMIYASPGYSCVPDLCDKFRKYGSRSQKLTLPPSEMDVVAGIQQTARVLPGKRYSIIAWQRDRFDGEERSPAENITCRLGYDPTGGTNAFAPSVTWYAFGPSHDAWHGVFRDVVPYSEGLTIFLEARRWATGSTEECCAWFDGIALMGCIAAPPTPTVTISSRYQSQGESISASWECADPDVSDYEWAVSTTTDESGIVTGGEWVSVGSSGSGTRSGLSLSNGQAVRVLVRASTKLGVVSGVGVSEPVRIVTEVPSIAAAKALPDGTWVLVKSACVGRMGDGPKCWVQEFDRTAGVKVEGDWAHLGFVLPGTRTGVAGQVSAQGRTKALTSAELLPSIGVTSPRPLGVRASNVIRNLPDVSGLLVMLIGKVKQMLPDGFVVDDGSVRGGLPVHCSVTVTPLEVGMFVRVVGIASPEGVFVREQGDVMSVE